MAETFPKFTVAAVQAAAVLFDQDKTIDKAVRFIEEAADRGATIIGFPELFVPGHTNVWYAAKNSNPLRAQGAMFRELAKNGVKVPSPATERLCTAAKKAHAYVVIGIIEVDTLYSGTLYISQLFISDTGDIMGVHRKLVTTSTEKLIYSNGDGSHLNVYDTPYGKLSAMNCGEHTHDLFKYALLALGTQIHVAAWPSFPRNIFKQPHWDAVEFRVRQFAHAGKIFVINCCAITDEQNIAVCCDTPDEKAEVVANSGGGSSIIGPSGEYLAGPIPEGEVVLTAEVSLEDALPGKQFHNVLGYYSRWDILSLNFNRERLSPFKNTPPAASNYVDFPLDLQKTKQEIHEIRQTLDRLVNNRE